MKQFERHDFVTLEAGWRDHLAAPLPENAAQHIAAWQNAGRPFVIASRTHGDQDGTLRLGLAGPGKTRLGFAVRAEAVTTRQPPPLLREIAPQLSAAWQSALAQIEAVAQAFDLEIRAFGSAAWQALTGLSYLTPISDLDLLITADPAKRDAGLAALAALETPMRLDGEIRLVGLGDIAWREWLSGAPRVLVKTRGGPRLIHRAEAA